MACVNSYFGRMKHRNEFRSASKLWQAVSPQWHRYLRMDVDHLKLTPLSGYSYNESMYNQFKNITTNEKND